MAMFEQHVNSAIVVSGILTVPLYSSELLTTNEALVVFLLLIIGGVLPDIDSENSKPIQITFRIISVLIPILILLAIGDGLSVIQILLVWGVLGLFTNLIFMILLKFTVHRGIIHSIPMGVFFGQIIIYIFYEVLGYSSTFALIAGIFLTIGFLLHLLLDEIVSLNAFGMRIKSSFGTAMKLYDRDNLRGTFVLYIAVVVMFLLIPIEMEVLGDIVMSFEDLEFR